MATGGRIRVVQTLEPETELEYKRRLTEPYLSQERLTQLFQAAGGEGTLNTVGAWLRGERQPGMHDGYLICQIINDHLPEDADPLTLSPFYVAPKGDGGAKIAKTAEVPSHNRWSDELGAEQGQQVA